MAVFNVDQGDFDSGPVTVDDATNFIAVATIKANRRRMLIVGEVGAGGDLGALKITQQAQDGGSSVVLMDDEVGAPNLRGQFIGLASVAAGGNFQMLLDTGAMVYTVWAKKKTGNTTLKIAGGQTR